MNNLCPFCKKYLHQFTEYEQYTCYCEYSYNKIYNSFFMLESFEYKNLRIINNYQSNYASIRKDSNVLCEIPIINEFKNFNKQKLLDKIDKILILL